MKFSTTKLEQFTIVPIDDFQLYIKNKHIITHAANAKAGYYIWDNYRSQKMDQVEVYARVFDDEGEPLEEPLFDIQDYYVRNDNDGTNIKLEPMYELPQ